MSHDLPSPAKPGEPGASNLAIALGVLRVIKDALEQFLGTGEAGSIDLRAVPPMDPATYGYLKELLAAGEVSAVIDTGVRIEVRETRYPGVWWLTHRNEQDAIVTELIEVTEVPEILKPHLADMRAGLTRLIQTLADPPPPIEPPTVDGSDEQPVAGPP